MNPHQIRKLSDSELLNELRVSVGKERSQTAEVLEFLREVDRRRLYADSGYSSLWEFCVKELGYTEASASRRISSMRLLRDLPDLKEDLLSGRQNLSSLSQAQKFFRNEEKHREVKLTLEQKEEILIKLEGKSTRECEMELLKLSSVPLEITRPEKQKVLDETYTELRLVLDAELLEKLNRIKALRSHAQPSMGYADLLKYMAEDILKRLDPTEKVKKCTSLPAPEVDSKQKQSRRIPIPASVKRQIWIRDQGKCGLVDPRTGESCGAVHFIEFDHIVPVALGGSNDASNLRLRCRGHNQRSAVKIFGPRWD